MATVLNKRGTRANLNALATSNGLKAGEIYLITDENRIAIGLSANTYEVYAKSSEVGGGGAITTVTLPTQSSVTPPSAGNVVLYSKEEAPDDLSLNYMMPNGSINQIQKFLCNGIVAFMPYGYGTTSVSTFGASPLTAVGASSANVVTGNYLTMSKRAKYTSAATAGSMASLYANSFIAGWRIWARSSLSDSIFRVRFGITDAAPVAGARSFFGLSNTITAPTNVAPETQINQIGLAVLDTDNTQFYIVYGGSAAQTPIPLGTAIGSPTDTTILWDFEIFIKKDNPTSFSYKLTNKNTGVSVSGTITGADTTDMPTTIVPRLYRTNNGAALAVSFDICYIYMEAGGQLA